MSEQIPPTGEADPEKNLKAEMNRKFDNITTELTEQRKLNEALLARMSQATAKPAEREPDLSELIYSDPKRYTELMEQRAEARIMQRLDTNQRKVNVINQLVNEYPETADAAHPLTKKAVEIYNALPDDEKTSPAAYRAAVSEAAMSLGFKPKSMRPADDEPSMGTGPTDGRRRRAGKTGLDPSTAEFARIMGLDVDGDAKLRERLEKRAQRNWNKYERVNK